MIIFKHIKTIITKFKIFFNKNLYKNYIINMNSSFKYKKIIIIIINKMNILIKI